MAGPWRAEVAAARGSASVVVGCVLGQDGLQVPLAGDQHLVGELVPGGEHEPFGMTVGHHRQLHPIRMIGTDVSV